jgi:N-dimethylarginine dimethylaminohydrolase
VDVLDDAFLVALAVRGIRLIPVSYKESRTLACNILSLDGRTILVAAGHERVATMLREKGFRPIPIDISEFAACGGGIHCLTMPLARG